MNSNIANLSGAAKDRILEALLQSHPQLMETIVQQVTGSSSSNGPARQLQTANCKLQQAAAAAAAAAAATHR